MRAILAAGAGAPEVVAAGAPLTLALPRRRSPRTWSRPYVGWFNTARLHESLGDIPPAEFEALYSPDQLALTAPASRVEPL